MCHGAPGCEVILLERFTESESSDYVARSDVGPLLSDALKQAIVVLSDGYPLWLAMVVEYLAKHGIPRELDEWQNADRDQRAWLAGDFLRRLIVP